MLPRPGSLPNETPNNVCEEDLKVPLASPPADLQEVYRYFERSGGIEEGSFQNASTTVKVEEESFQRMCWKCRDHFLLARLDLKTG